MKYVVREKLDGKRDKFHGPFESRTTAEIRKVSLMEKWQDSDKEFYIEPKKG